MKNFASSVLKVLMVATVVCLVAALLLTVNRNAHAGSPALYSQDGKFLGYVNNNRYDPNSVANPYGRYGSRYSPDSVNNPYGRYGSQYSPESVNNPYATGGGIGGTLGTGGIGSTFGD